MGQEIEYKLRSNSAQELAQVYDRLRVRFGDMSPERTIEMFTRYFDTPDGILRARRWTLRIRQENDRQVLTCKTPGAGHSRGEWELIRTADGAAPTAQELRALASLGAPEDLCSLGSLSQTCGARFTRRACMLTLPDARIELAADAGELFGTQEREPFFELELELCEGRAEVLSTLAAGTGLREEPRSKQARAMLLL